MIKLNLMQCDLLCFPVKDKYHVIVYAPKLKVYAVRTNVDDSFQYCCQLSLTQNIECEMNDDINAVNEVLDLAARYTDAKEHVEHILIHGNTLARKILQRICNEYTILRI